MNVPRGIVLLLLAGCTSTGAAAVADAGSCDELRGRAQTEMSDAAARAAEQSTCSADRDCVEIQLGGCGGSPCGGSVIVDDAGRTAIQQAEQQVENDICAPARDAGCPPPEQPPCTASALVPYCDAGRCASRPVSR